MKTLFISIFATFLALTSCNVNSDSGFPFNIKQKEGTGIIKSKEFMMSFDEIKVAQSIKAEVVKSNEEKVVVTAPSDILDDILVENNNGQLYIHFKPNLNISARNIAVKIFAKDFSAVKASSSATIIIKDQFTQDKTDLLNQYNVGEQVKVSINIRGREWVSPQGETKYFNSIQGWRIEKMQAEAPSAAQMPPMPASEAFEPATNFKEEEHDDLPF